MAAPPSTAPLTAEQLPNVDHLVTEDDTPVDSIFSAKQQRLLVEPLYSSWSAPGNGLFLADANVGVFDVIGEPPLVPDGFLSLGVQASTDWSKKINRSYFIRKFGKPPDVVAEVVSNTEGGEDTTKLVDYARMGVPYYVIFDPLEVLGHGVLRIFELHNGDYEPFAGKWLPAIGLGLTLWPGIFECMNDTWLRWCDVHGQVIPTGAERAQQEHERAERALKDKERHGQRADQERQRADQERQRADQERQRADQERQRAERLAAQLRALGIEDQT